MECIGDQVRPQKHSVFYEKPVALDYADAWFYKDMIIPESWIEDMDLDSEYRAQAVPGHLGCYAFKKTPKERTKEWWDDVYYEATRSLVIGV